MAKIKTPNFENEKVIKVRLWIRLKRLFLPLYFNTIYGMLKKLGYRDIEHISTLQINAGRSDNTISIVLD